jgi:AcrR family transcriptional regulator
MRARILDAALDGMTLFGISRLALGDVAKRAGVSRQTVYRYFAGRDELIAAVLAREEEALIELSRTAAAEAKALDEALTAAVMAITRAAAEHALIVRLLAADPETLVSQLLNDRTPVLHAARPALTDLILDRAPHLDPERARAAGDALGRLITSWVLVPPAGARDDVAAEVARIYAAGLLETADP